MSNVSKLKVYDLAESIAASGYPMRTETNKELKIIQKAIKNNSFGKSDDTKAIYKRVVNLGNSNGGHDQFLTGIRVAFDLTFSNKAWVEAERYRFLEFVSSQSTMHRMCSFDLKVQYNDYVDKRIVRIMKSKVKEYNKLNNELKALKEKNASTQLIKDLADTLAQKYLEILYSNPAGFIITARVTTNYRCLKNIYFQRKNHRLPEWREFCKYIEENLPYFKDFCLGKE
jgi:hypothetical protein